MKAKKPTEIAEEIKETHLIVEDIDPEKPKQEVDPFEDKSLEEKSSHKSSERANKYELSEVEITEVKYEELQTEEKQKSFSHSRSLSQTCKKLLIMDPINEDFEDESN